ncbi:hypothetical protein [Methanoregula sp.]|uniref:hypothetical protein n=1 Tax=Methanoregula sp. TaxID=2052170 RepID=UPI003C75B9B1
MIRIRPRHFERGGLPAGTRSCDNGTSVTLMQRRGIFSFRHVRHGNLLIKFDHRAGRAPQV